MSGNDNRKTKAELISELEKLRKQLKTALRESEQKYRNIIESIPVGMHMYELMPDGSFVFIGANPAADKILGVDNKQFVGKTIEEAFPALADSEIPERYRSTALEGIHWQTDQVIYEEGGIKGAFVVEAFQISPGKMVATFFDITERKRAEEALRESEEKYRYLVETMNEGLVVVDENQVLTYTNWKFSEMLGYTRDELIGQNAINFVAEESHEDFHTQKFKRIHGETSQYELVWKHKQGNFIYTIISPHGIFDKENMFKGCIGVLTDITERKRAEEEKKRLEEQLRQSQKLEAIGRLAGGVAHDFNNQLTVILNMCSMLQKSVDPQDHIFNDLQMIIVAAEHSARLTEQLLAFSRKQIVEPRILNLNEMITGSQKMLGRIIGEDVELVLNLDPEAGNIKIDPGQLEQIVVNLVLNARDAMQGGGTITIETKNVFLDEHYAQSNVYVTPGPFVLLSVSDTGVGLDEKVKSRIFEPFFTTKEQGKGTGLGLSTVYGIVAQCGGSIVLESELDMGSMFKIFLPRIEEEKRTIPSVETKPKKDVAYGSATVLIIEDDEFVRQTAKRILETHGYNILEAADGKNALNVFQRHSAIIDIIITDVVMPGMSGKELADNLLKTNPALKVLYISGYPDDVIAHHGVLEEDIHFLQKPFTVISLLNKVQSMLTST